MNEKVGQLIKLQDYVSRYEQDIFLYPSRYVRLKKQQWQKLRSSWENRDMLEQLENIQATPDWYEEGNPFVNKVKGLFKFGKKESEHEEREKIGDEAVEASPFQFAPSFTFHPETEEELKHQFLEQLFTHQLRWASKTLVEKSIVHNKFYFDERLKYFLQRFPDTVLVLYHPIFLLNKAPVEVEIILVTPTEAWCISFLEKEESAVFVGSSDHFWIKRYKDREEKILNPLLALNRTEKIVKQIFQLYEIDLPLHKVVLSRNGYIDFPAAPYDSTFIEKRNYEKWFQSMRMNRAPLKHIQLKAAQSLLEYCQTTSMYRPEWENDPDLESE